jgi:mannosyltransferase OCH1-like enzyme
MRISDILIKENNNSGQIILHKEGLFWRAYEQSAYLFSKYVRKYQVVRKHFKNVEKDIVFLGFPHSAKEDDKN